MSFYLFGTYDEKLRLRSFSASVKGEKATISIVIETADLDVLGYTLGRLKDVKTGQRAKPGQLALPAPEY